MAATKSSSGFNHLPRAASGPLKCALTGQQLLSVAQYNKGSAFPNDERKEFGLYGLLPPKIQTLEEQVDRAYQQYSSCGDDLAKNTFMASMKAQNEVLYYKVREILTSPQLGGVPSSPRTLATSNAPQGNVQHHIHTN